MNIIKVIVYASVQNFDREIESKTGTNSANLMSSRNRLSIFRCSKFGLFVLFFILFRHGFGQEISSKIDKKDLKSFIKTLSSSQFSGRGLDDEGQIKTQEFIVNRFKELQLEPFSHGDYLERFSLNQTNRGEIYVKTQNHQKLRNFDRMIFLATSAEEGGLLGARYHVGKADFDPDQIVCNFNIDMISRCDNKQTDCKYLYVLGSNQSGMLDSLLRIANTIFHKLLSNMRMTLIFFPAPTVTISRKRESLPSCFFLAFTTIITSQPTPWIKSISIYWKTASN